MAEVVGLRGDLAREFDAQAKYARAESERRAAEAADPWAGSVRVDFLVYGECVCGWWMATSEGGLWPDCPRCDRKVLPRRDRSKDGNGVSSAHGYVAELRPELEALAEANRRDRGEWPEGRLYDPADPLLARAQERDGPYWVKRRVRQLERWLLHPRRMWRAARLDRQMARQHRRLR